MTERDPIQALARLRERGFKEGLTVRDVRAGTCEIETLTASSVILTAETGQPLNAGTAADFLDAIETGSIQRGDDS